MSAQPKSKGGGDKAAGKKPAAGGVSVLPKRRLQVAQEVLRRARRRRARTVVWFLGFAVFLPTLLAAGYYYFVARERFTSTALLTVRSGNTAAAKQDALALKDYLQSRAALAHLDANHGFSAHFRGRGADPWSGLGEHASFEQAYANYRAQVETGYDPHSGLMKIQVSAFEPAAAREFATGLVASSESMLHTLSTGSQTAHLRAREKRVQELASRMLPLRDRIRRAETASVTPASAAEPPRVPVDPASGASSVDVGQLVKARAELRALEAAYEQALTEKEAAQLAALDQSTVLITVAPPSLPDEASEPKRLLGHPHGVRPLPHHRRHRRAPRCLDPRARENLNRPTETRSPSRAARWTSGSLRTKLAGVKLGNFSVGNRDPLFLIAGPCVVESEALVIDVASELAELTGQLGMGYVFKASFDKANRTSARSFRGPGMDAGLRALERVSKEVGVPVLTDVHENTPVHEVARVVDVLQTPAFLARQTDFIQRVARAGKPVNVKKAQFQAPWDMVHVVEKCRDVGNDQILLCERGTSFGYNTLVSDMRGLAVMRRTGCPVVFDATHSVQQPGGQGASSGGERRMVPLLARAAVAAGVAGVFMETHPDPDRALSDGPNSWPLSRMRGLLEGLVELDRAVKARPFDEDVDA